MVTRHLSNDQKRFNAWFDSHPAWVETGGSLRFLFWNAWLAATITEREACADICKTLPLTLEHNVQPSHDMAVAEAGCRGAFAHAILERAG